MEAVGEIALLPKNIALNSDCSCGLAVNACDLWTSVIGNLSEQIAEDIYTNPYALNTGYPRASITIDRNHQTKTYLLVRKIVHGLVYLQLRFGMDAVKTLTRKFQEGLDVRFALYDAILAKQKADVVIDSSKFYLDGIALYKHRPELTRVILLTRDGRGVMNSNLKRNVSEKQSVQSWLTYYERILPLLETNVDPQHVLRVRYEDLTEDPTKELTRICEFIGTVFEPSMLDFASHVHHITNANDMRFSTSSTIRRDTSWQDNLSEQNLRYFKQRAGRLNLELGYH